MVAHYDSRATDPLDATSDAPGANDDGSGTAALLEAARVLSKRRFDATIVFLAVAGEEQGLLGSAFHAVRARADKLDVAAVLSNDIVGDPSGPDGRSSRREIRLFSEGLPRAATIEDARKIASLGGESDSPSRELARFVAEVAALHRTRVQPLLVFRADRFLRGGDHLSFNEQRFPAVRFTDVFEKYDRQHQNVRVEDGRRFGDAAEFVDADYLADVVRLNAACLAHLAAAPAPPVDGKIVATELTTDTKLRWSRSPTQDVAGYEVAWRRTTSPTWEHVVDVGDALETTVPLSKDEWLFGLRAYDREGWRSVVAFPAAERK
jgi:Zn-dependent M28 family amino/carboxypeptidase